MEILSLVVILALLLSPIFLFARFRQKAEQRRSEVWSEIARQTGLVFKPGSASLLSYILQGFLSARPEIRGDYRGRHVSMKRVVEYGYEYSNEYTAISIQVKNPTRCMLDIRPKGLFRRKSRLTGISTGNEQFDRRFSVDGQPRQYVQKAVAEIARSDPDLIASLASNPPYIKLDHSQLTCTTGERTSVHEQIALLILLCDLAQLADEIGSDTDA